MKPAGAVIFDLDGVIVDSEPLHELAFLNVFGELGYGESHGIVFSNYYGRSDRVLWEDFIARHRPSQLLNELQQRKQAWFLKQLRLRRPVFSGLPLLVRKLARRYALAVASGSSHDVIDCALGLESMSAFSARWSAWTTCRAANRRPTFSCARRSCCECRRRIAG